MNLTLGFSPCPNDTFIFDALVNRKINSEGLSFDVVMEDVQTLNEWAVAGKLDITKLSYGVLPLVLKDYILLNSGGALGKGVGPLLIAKQPVPLEKINYSLVAIPGEHTTAHLLFSLAFPDARKKKFMPFNEVENAVLGEKVDAGVIIHESRFTYEKKGLFKIMDLGDYWENTSKAPIPLGGIAARRNLPEEVKIRVDDLIRRSIAYAFSNYPEIPGYVKLHAQEMDETVMKKHIDLYVNEFSVQLGEDGKKAVKKLVETYHKLHPEAALPPENIFIR